MDEPRVETVTPKKAQTWINKNNGNRTLREGVVERYADDMRNGKWTTCPMPISFYENGDVADGQHRLWAIVESETSQKFIIVRGLAKEDGLNIDTGVTRNVIDNARISGVDTGLNATMLSAARAIADGQRVKGSRSNAQKLAPVEKYREAAEFCACHAPRVKFVSNSMVLGAIGRAFLHEQDKERLVRFCAVMRSGLIENDGESAAVALRNYLMTKGTMLASQTLWVDTFLKAQNAIHSFMRGRPLHFIKAVKGEAYPLKDASEKPTKGMAVYAKRGKQAKADTRELHRSA